MFPERKSSIACCNSWREFMTNGPYRATGSPIGWPAMSSRLSGASVASFDSSGRAVEQHHLIVSGHHSAERRLTLDQRALIQGSGGILCAGADRCREFHEAHTEHRGNVVPAVAVAQQAAEADRHGQLFP